MPAEYYNPMDQQKNDFQNAIKRNLHTWTQWRIKINNNLVDAVVKGSDVQDIEPFGRYMNHEVLDPKHPTTNPKTLMTYSASTNSATNLQRRYFYKYGIPRVRLSPSNVDSTLQRKAAPAEDWDACVSGVTGDELELDYFYYDKPKDEKTRQYSGEVRRDHGETMAGGMRHRGGEFNGRSHGRTRHLVTSH